MNQASKRVLDQAPKLLVALDVYVETHSFLPDEQSDGGDLARRCKARSSVGGFMPLATQAP